MKIIEIVKWLFRPTYNCDCNQSRKDGYHNLECISWLNDWNYKENIKLLSQPKGELKR